MAYKRKTKHVKKAKLASSIGNGWISTDEEEVERRRLRSMEESLSVKVVKVKSGTVNSIYRDYQIYSNHGGQYKVEYRDKTQRINSCDCPDFRVNGLGTCKHIERVSRFLLRKKAPHVRYCTEIYIDPTDGNKVKILWADKLRKNSKVVKLLSGYFSVDNSLLVDHLGSFEALHRNVIQSGLTYQEIKLSDNILPWLERKYHQEKSVQNQNNYLKDVSEGKRQLNVVNPPLYDYQRAGMLHLVFKERAILADEMGLGKTVQAVAACELLHQLRGIQRVLVISPVSLKTEWQEQITKFTGRDSLIIEGDRARRLKQYQQSSFFYLANYEQLLSDQEDVQSLLMPDVIILDEAQRVKNWQTKTAGAIKKLSSRYIFVLTGTPLENRIDEIYSIAQVVDPQILGPLFRFNREFYQLDDKGKPAGLKNLDVLHHKLQPILLRRRKSDVDTELPDRVINTYFVKMTEEQSVRYQEYKTKLAKLLFKAKRQPLIPDDFKRIQMYLACMRMLCDTTYILDQDCRESPKLDELKKILKDQLEDPANKIIIFSEWTKMLDLIREYLDQNSIAYALHTGQVKQNKRRAEINRFKEDPDCRLFLSSDAGATGLNLQIANIVINMDLPWNPAKLEQRIARAWRKQQTRQVNVINLVCESSIEHRMMSILKQKTLLAESVLDGSGEPDMDMPSGRKVMLDRLEQIMGDTSPLAKTRDVNQNKHNIKTTLSPIEAFSQEVDAKYPEMLESLAVFENTSGENTTLAVTCGDVETQGDQLKDVAANHSVSIGYLETIDSSTMATIQRLIDAGILSLNDAQQTLKAAPVKADQEKAKRQLWRAKANKRFSQVDRKFQMAKLLVSGDFIAEALSPTINALELGLSCFIQANTGKIEPSVDLFALKSRYFEDLKISQEVPTLLVNLKQADYRLTQSNLEVVQQTLSTIEEHLLYL